MINKIVVLLGLAGLVASCSGNGRIADSKTDIKPSDLKFDVERELSVCDSIVIDDVFDVLNWNITDSLLHIVCDSRDSIIRVYDVYSGDVITAGGSIGQGGGEMIVVNPGDAKDNRHILLYDIMRRKINVYDTSLKTLSEPVDYELLTDEDGLSYPYTYISQITDSVFLLKMDMADKSMWQLANLTDNTVLWEYENQVRDNEQSYTPFDFIQVVEDGTIAAIFKYMPLVMFYDISEVGGPKLRECYGRLENHEELESYDDLQFCYLSACEHNGLLYCLKSIDGGDRGDMIEVYDMINAKPLNILKLDRMVMEIRCNNKGNITGYSPDMDNSVFYIFSNK